MEFEGPLIEARLLRRYKRFLADVEFSDGRQTTVHCPNTGSMLGCCESGARIWLSRSSKPHRKYPLTWELVETAGANLVGVNTQRTNHLVKEGLESGAIAPLAGYSILRAEVPFPGGEGRVDFFLETEQGCYFLEVKNVTAAVSDRRALFPDAVSERASRHVLALANQHRAGHGAGLLFCAQRSDVDCISPADEIDPAYGRNLRAAVAAGIDVWAYRAAVSCQEIVLTESIPVKL